MTPRFMFQCSVGQISNFLCSCFIYKIKNLTRLKHGWFPLKLCLVFLDFKPALNRNRFFVCLATWFNFLKFVLSYKHRSDAHDLTKFKVKKNKILLHVTFFSKNSIIFVKILLIFFVDPITIGGREVFPSPPPGFFSK